MSVSHLCLANAVLTIPFGVLGLVSPYYVSGQFGLVYLIPTTQFVFRAFAATALGYGTLVVQLRSVPEAHGALLVASAVFNLAQMTLQGHAIRSQTGFNDINGTAFIAHALIGILSVRLLIKRSSDPTKAKAK